MAQHHLAWHNLNLESLRWVHLFDRTCLDMLRFAAAFDGLPPRFVFLLAFVAARAIAFSDSLGLEGPRAPVFNLSALVLIPTLLLAEILEDEIVTREWLPMNPVGPGLLKVNVNGDNADPAQLITLEHLPNVPDDDPWKVSEISNVSKRTTRTSLEEANEGNILKTPSLSIFESSKWSNFRKYLGQPRGLNPSPSLQGLRELPFMFHFSFANIVCNIASSLIALLLGGGYMRGMCSEPLDGINRILGIVWWDVPLPCE